MSLGENMSVNNPKVSVILPSLNVKLFISECIESVINQTLDDIEIICVDAGSTDGTLEILKEYEERDSRVRIINSDKKSYGYQMNLGIDSANGEYIGIVETDDFIDEEMFQTLYDFTNNGSAEISKANFYHFYDYGDFKADGTKKHLPTEEFTIFDNPNILNGHPSIWAAIYKRSFLKEKNIKFIEAPGGAWVDNPFLFETFVNAKRIMYKDKPYYFYRELNPNSSTNKLNDLTLPMKRMMDNLDVLERHNINDEDVLYALYFRIFWHIRDILNRDNLILQEKEVYEYFRLVLRRLNKDIVMNKFDFETKKIYFKYLSPISLISSYNQEYDLMNEDIMDIINENNFLNVHIGNLEDIINDLNSKNKNLHSKNKKLKSDNKKLKKKIKGIKGSKSFKLGSLLTSPVRKIKRGTEKPKDNFTPVIMGPKEKTRILFIPSDNNRTSGAFLSMANLIVNLREKYDLDIFVIVPQEGHGQEILDSMNIPYQLINSKDWVIPLSRKKDESLLNEISDKKKINKIAIKNLRKFIKINKIDLLHINTTYSYVGAEAALKEKIPFVWHLREFLEEDQSNTTWNRSESNKLINKSDRIIAISDSIFKKYEDVFDNGKLVRIYNGIDAKKFYNPNKNIFQSKRIRFIMVGGFELYKGQIEFAKACSKLYNNGFTNFEVWFVGTGNPSVKSTVEKIISDGGMDNVKFLGYKKDVENYYKKSDISFTCAKSEAFGRTTVEAMLSGNLVIGADSAGTKELIKDGKTGILFKHEDIDDLYEKMLFAINNLDASRDIAENGQQYMFENMTAEINADKIYEVYSEILKL